MNRGDLKQYRKNLHSQNGEDGILEEICQRLAITKGWFVEFGAWDGRHLSNAYHLLADKGWSGVFIEGDPKKYEDLLKTKAAFPERLHTICAMVGFEGESRLDNLLGKTPVPKEFDILSIDIDSYDWQVWNALENYRPKIVVIESNCSIPVGEISVHEPPARQGASFTALTELGTRKGYQLVCHTGNCIFVVNELVPELHLPAELLALPEKLFDYPKHYKERLINLARKLVPKRWMEAAFRFSQQRKAAANRKNIVAAIRQ